MISDERNRSTSAWAQARHKRRHLFALLLIVLLLVLQRIAGIPLLKPSPYNSYTLQAMAWRSGQAYLTHDVPHLELAIRDGRYYVSFPPVPSLPIYPLTFIFGGQVPDGLLVKLYVLIAYYALCRLLMRRGWRETYAAALSWLLCAASSMLPMLLTGAVWYQAQVMAFMWTALALDAMFARRPTRGLLFYALAVGCRPFNALYGPLLMALYLADGEQSSQFQGIWRKTKSMIPGVLLGLCVAAAYGWYNLLRFGNPLEFGHNYLPEFSFQGGIQFSLRHIPDNITGYILTLPFEHAHGIWSLRRFGFSLFVANPILLMMLVWAARDGMRRCFSWQKAAVMLTFTVHLLLLLSHRTFGGFQYGARYAVDLIPYAALYLAVDRTGDKWTKPLVIVMTLGLALAVYGSLVVALPN